MSESTTNKHIKNKKSKAEKVLEVNAHPILIFYEIIFIFSIFYAIYYNKINFITGSLAIIISFFLTYYNYYKRKIVITANKFYIYRLGKKTVSLNFSNQFFQIKFEKTKLGRILNYGTLILIDQENKYYKIDFISNPESVFFSSIKEYEKIQEKINPNYVKTLNEETNNLDKIESLDTVKIDTNKGTK